MNLAALLPVFRATYSMRNASCPQLMGLLAMASSSISVRVRGGRISAVVDVMLGSPCERF